MRGRLLLGAVAAALAALLSADVRPGAAAASCTATATGAHARTQVLHVHLSSGCPATGTATGTLRFAQWPRIHGSTPFTLEYAAATLHLRVPRSLTLKPAWSARGSGAGLAVRVKATPKRRLHGTGALTVTGGFTASNGAVVRWRQALHASVDRVTLGAIHITATLPGTHAMVIEVHQVREYCDTSRGCPFAKRTTTETSSFPARYTRVTVDSALWFATGNGTLRSGKERPTILLRSKRSGRILGRSDFQAVIRAD
ncbi:MAG TPA: hypothetical protein VGC71_07110 [Gaiellales bacterium]|jgi:hypothetical protein